MDLETPVLKNGQQTQTDTLQFFRVRRNNNNYWLSFTTACTHIGSCSSYIHATLTAGLGVDENWKNTYIDIAHYVGLYNYLRQTLLSARSQKHRSGSAGCRYGLLLLNFSCSLVYIFLPASGQEILQWCKFVCWLVGSFYMLVVIFSKSRAYKSDFHEIWHWCSGLQQEIL